VSVHLSPAQVELIDAFDAGDHTNVSFTTAALEMGMSTAQVLKVIRDRDNADAIAAEEMREERAAGGQFGAGA